MITKTDLLKALKECEHYESPELKELVRLNQKADAALEEFKETNIEYIRLANACHDSYRKQWDFQKKERQEISGAIKKCRTAIHSSGVTKITVRMVQCLVKKLVLRQDNELALGYAKKCERKPCRLT